MPQLPKCNLLVVEIRYRQKSIILKDFVNIGQVRMSLLNLLEVEVWVFFSLVCAARWDLSSPARD